MALLPRGRRQATHNRSQLTRHIVGSNPTGATTNKESIMLSFSFNYRKAL